MEFFRTFSTFIYNSAFHFYAASKDISGMLDSNFYSTVIGAIIGAAISGYISYLIQRRNIEHARAERERSKNEKDIALANAISLKMMRIYSNIYDFHFSIETLISKSGSKIPDNPCLIIKPFAGSPQHISFSYEEMALVISFKNEELVKLIQSIDTIHNHLIDMLDEYKKNREHMFNSFPLDFFGPQGQLRIPMDWADYYTPRLSSLNENIWHIRNQLFTDFDESKKILELNQIEINNNLNLKTIIAFDEQKIDNLKKIRNNNPKPNQIWDV